LVDHLGLLNKVLVSAANCGDRDGLGLLLERMKRDQSKIPTLIYADQGYSGEAMRSQVFAYGSRLEVVERAKGWCLIEQKLKRIRQFTITAKRWIVERTFAWLSRYRRLSKDYELYPSTSESWIYLAMSRLMVRRYEKI
jgi:putative transposase